jgi:ABC-type antimicrobial peptide transport system permease subunit
MLHRRRPARNDRERTRRLQEHEPLPSDSQISDRRYSFSYRVNTSAGWSPAGASDNPIGATILVKGVPMRVVGLLAAKGQSTFGQDQDDLIMIPFTRSDRRGSAARARV